MRAFLIPALVIAACSSSPARLPPAKPADGAPAKTTPDASVRELTVEATSTYERIHLYVHVKAPAAKPKGTLVLVHGGPGVSHEYMLPLERLADDGYTVVTYDQRGVGKTPPPERARDQGLDEHAEDLDRIRAALHVETIDLVAHSYGGLIAMAYATYHAEHVRSLIFVDSMPPAFNDYLAGQFYFGEKMTALQRQGLVAKDLPEADGADCSKSMIAILPVYFFDPKHPATANLAGSTCNQKAFDDTTSANQTFDFTAQLAAVNAPTLVLQGEADPFTSQMAKAIMRAMTGAAPQLVMFPKCGHLPWAECPEPFYAAVRTFLAARP